MNKSIHFKVGLFLVGFIILSLSALLYLLYARGTFEPKAHFTLIAFDATGIEAGTPLVYRGIAIGSVTGVSHSDRGLALIKLSLPEHDHRWVRNSSMFTLDKPLVGAASIRLDTDNLDVAVLPDGASMPLMLTPPLDIPGLAAKANAILDQLATVSANVAQMTRKDSEINTTLGNLKTITGQMTGKYGVAGGLLGGDKQAQVLMDTLQNVQALTANLNQISHKLDRWAFAQGGVADKTDQSLAQLQKMLAEIQTSLKKVDTLLVNANGLTGNLKDGTDDLVQLRSQVDEAVSQANQLMLKINRFLPSSKAGEVKLP
jgi:phospholipid/cholesterol/gamma-HCH transport system substrate-binding protein